MSRLTLTLLIVAGPIACWGGVSDEEYTVFTALLSSDPASCVAESTEASASAVQALEGANLEADGIGPDALRDFIARNSISVRIRRSRVGVKDLEVIVGEVTPEQRQSCGRVLTFSRAGFNHDHDRAVVSVANRISGESEYLVLFAKQAGAWKPLRSIALPRT